MKLTKEDAKHIQEQVRKLQWRIVDEATEYAKLYEKAYLEAVIEACKSRIEAIDNLHDRISEMTNR